MIGGWTSVEHAAVDQAAARRLAAQLYDALATGDRASLDALLHPEFQGRTTEGLPLELGGTYDGPTAMRRQFCGRIARSFLARAEPPEFAMLDDGRLLVAGRYSGKATASGAPLDAEFVHLLSFADGRVRALVQLTDSARWRDALGEQAEQVVRLSVTDGIGVIGLHRPHARNAIDQAVADGLYDVAQRCATQDDLRAVLIVGSGSAFSVGGDIALFAETAGSELPALLRRMTTPFHESLRILAGLPVPVVAAVHGAVAGGGLGLLHCADIAIAAQGTKFAAGFAALGLTSDGGSSWYLPRLVGLRRATQFYFENRVLDAHEAAEWGLVSEVVAPEELDERAQSIVEVLAAGPTRAFGEIRRLLRGGWSATLAEQLRAETDALARVAATSDARGAIAAFLAKTTATFEGR
jgi:2-(1,2-epoxy-1,2-dihydrophenyl)acetyl-CoA isomerase